MRLDDIRKNINEIDDKMKTLFDARMECATDVKRKCMKDSLIILIMLLF